MSESESESSSGWWCNTSETSFSSEKRGWAGTRGDGSGDLSWVSTVRSGRELCREWRGVGLVEAGPDEA